MVNQILNEARDPSFLENYKLIKVLKSEETTLSFDFLSIFGLDVWPEAWVSWELFLFDHDSATYFAIPCKVRGLLGYFGHDLVLINKGKQVISCLNQVSAVYENVGYVLLGSSP